MRIILPLKGTVVLGMTSSSSTGPNGKPHSTDAELQRSVSVMAGSSRCVMTTMILVQMAARILPDPFETTLSRLLIDS